MKAISVYDLQLIPELSKLSPFDIIHPDNDELVNGFLKQMGFDLNSALIYTACQHRTLKNEVKIGYMIRGEVNSDRKYLNGEWSTLYDRMVAAAKEDPSLCKALCEQLNSSLDYSAFHATKESDTSWTEADFPSNLCNPDESLITTQIKQLEDLLMHIRGNPFKEDGSRKTPADYRNEKTGKKV